MVATTSLMLQHDNIISIMGRSALAVSLEKGLRMLEPAGSA